MLGIWRAFATCVAARAHRNKMEVSQFQSQNHVDISIKHMNVAYSNDIDSIFCNRFNACNHNFLLSSKSTVEELPAYYFLSQMPFRIVNGQRPIIQRFSLSLHGPSHLFCCAETFDSIQTASRSLLLHACAGCRRTLTSCADWPWSVPSQTLECHAFNYLLPLVDSLRQSR